MPKLSRRFKLVFGSLGLAFVIFAMVAIPLFAGAAAQERTDGGVETWKQVCPWRSRIEVTVLPNRDIVVTCVQFR